MKLKIIYLNNIMRGYKQFLDKETFNNKGYNLKVTKVKKTNKGYIVHLFTNYITLRYKYITLFSSGCAKVVTKVDRNYQKKYQYTNYEDNEGKEISLKDFNKLNK